jgi:hypothetical protein
MSIEEETLTIFDTYVSEGRFFMNDSLQVFEEFIKETPSEAPLFLFKYAPPGKLSPELWIFAKCDTNVYINMRVGYSERVSYPDSNYQLKVTKEKFEVVYPPSTKLTDTNTLTEAVYSEKYIRLLSTSEGARMWCGEIAKLFEEV